MTGTEQVISVGDRGTLRLQTYQDLTGASGVTIYLYTEAGFAAGSTYIKSLSATAPTPANGLIQAAMAADLFPASGKYIVRAGVTWADGEILGAPAEVQVTRGKTS